MKNFIIQYSELKKLGSIQHIRYVDKTVLHHGDSLNSTVYQLVCDVKFKTVNRNFSILSCIARNTSSLNDICISFNKEDLKEISALSDGNIVHIDIDTHLYTINKDNIDLQYKLFNITKREGYFVNDRNMLLYSKSGVTYIVTFRNKSNFTVTSVIEDKFSQFDKISQFDNWLTNKTIIEAVTTDRFTYNVYMHNRSLCSDGKNIDIDDLLIKFKELLIDKKLYELYIEFIGDGRV